MLGVHRPDRYAVRHSRNRRADRWRADPRHANHPDLGAPGQRDSAELGRRERYRRTPGMKSLTSPGPALAGSPPRAPRRSPFLRPLRVPPPRTARNPGQCRQRLVGIGNHRAERDLHSSRDLYRAHRHRADVSAGNHHRRGRPYSVTLYKAAAGTGAGLIEVGTTATIGTIPAAWWVNIPSGAAAGAYLSTITMTFTTGPSPAAAADRSGGGQRPDRRHDGWGRRARARRPSLVPSGPRRRRRSARPASPTPTRSWRRPRRR